MAAGIFSERSSRDRQDDLDLTVMTISSEAENSPPSVCHDMIGGVSGWFNGLGAPHRYYPKIGVSMYALSDHGMAR